MPTSSDMIMRMLGFSVAACACTPASTADANIPASSEARVFVLMCILILPPASHEIAVWYCIASLDATPRALHTLQAQLV